VAVAHEHTACDDASADDDDDDADATDTSAVAVDVARRIPWHMMLRVAMAMAMDHDDDGSEHHGDMVQLHSQQAEWEVLVVVPKKEYCDDVDTEAVENVAVAAAMAHDGESTLLLVAAVLELHSWG
jgi:hypothetical protein